MAGSMAETGESVKRSSCKTTATRQPQGVVILTVIPASAKLPAMNLRRQTGFGLPLAVGLSAFLALAAVGIAFLGADTGGALMRTPPALAVIAFVFLVLVWSTITALCRRQYASLLLHFGAVLVMAGGVIGSGVVQPFLREGYIPLVETDRSNHLYDSTFRQTLAELPFTVQLDSFSVDLYPPPPGATPDEAAHQPVREYRSRVTLLRADQAPLTRDITVNHPLSIDGYLVYQMSWGKQIDNGQPILYSVLMVVRDPGLPLVFSGLLLIEGATLVFAIQALRRQPGGQP